jgi:amino acid adenylation domain-containing protein
VTDMTKRLASLPEDRRAQFLAQLRAQIEGAATRGPRPRNDTGPAPLSHSQETLWFLDKLAPGQPTYSVPLCYRIRGDLDIGVLRAALAAMVARHEALRTAIVEREEGPVQVIADEVPVELPVYEATGADSSEREAAALEILAEQTRTPFELSRMPLWRAFLVRVAPDDHFFFFNVHHIVFDGWSLGLFSAGLAELYRAGVEGTPAQLPELAIQYPDYACWQREWLSSEGMDKLSAYWRDQLAGAEVLDFPADRPRGDTITFNGSYEQIDLGTDVAAQVREVAKQEGVTPFVGYLAAFFVFLKRCTGIDDLVIGSPNANRRHSSTESVLGFFINMMVLRADLSGDLTYRELVRRLKPVAQDALAHGDLPFGKLVEAVQPPRDPSRSPVFQIVFALQNVGAPVRLPGLAVSSTGMRPGTSRFDMSWNLIDRNDGGSQIGIEYNSDLFDASSIIGFAGHYRELVRKLTAAPDAALDSVDMLTAAERHDLIRVGSGPSRPVRDTTIVAGFEAQVRRAPQATALICSGSEMTYGELNQAANRLAVLLREHGAKPGTTVGICQPRRADLVVSMLAVLKTGAAYLPLDPAHPAARVAMIAADAGAVLILAGAADAISSADVDAPVLVLPELADQLAALPGDDAPSPASSRDDAYVIYTSGSTGQPKGVAIEHGSVVSFIDSVTELFELTPADRMLGFASATFDVSIFEIFSALLTGASLRYLTDQERLSVETLQAVMEKDGITVIDLPPAVMSLLEPERFGDLRIVFAGCEAYSGALVNRWNAGRRFINGYGPTECTVTMTVQECAGTWTSSPPIGLPMVNHVAHVLDSRLRLLPAGVPGELVIGGAGLTHGYLGSPELTAEKFVTDPFGTAPNGRLYRTGDLVKRLPDGSLTFLGRVDQQVKIRGLRIEIGEIESAMASYPGIGQVCAGVWADDSGEKHLVGYLTSAGSQPGPGPLRDHLAQRLPAYMIPAFFVTLPELPLNSSGKVDRRRLPDPDPASAASAATDEPRNDTERVLLHEVLIPLLHNDRIGIHDDFFRVGGNSLQAVQLMSSINRRFSVEIALADFFAAPTVAHLATIVDARQISAMSDDELLDMLENMPDDQVSRLLGDTGTSA